MFLLFQRIYCSLAQSACVASSIVISHFLCPPKSFTVVPLVCLSISLSLCLCPTSIDRIVSFLHHFLSIYLPVISLFLLDFIPAFLPLFQSAFLPMPDLLSVCLPACPSNSRYLPFRLFLVLSTFGPD